jgi:hypothetical protein
MNEHAEVRELLELAALEPGGLDRLEAGDTPAASFAVGHLAACPDCLEELARLRRAETLLRPILASEPDPALRDRTLALVRDVGVTRGDSGAVGVAPVGVTHDAAVSRDDMRRARRRAGPGPRGWLGLVAAALVNGLAGGALVTGRGGGSDAAVAALEDVAHETAALYAAPDVQQVALVDTSGETKGSFAFAASVDRLEVLVAGLQAPAAGMEYRCWVEAGGARTTIGVLHLAGKVAWWTGDVAIPAPMPSGTLYGVSLAATGSTDPGTTVLTGKL